ncbi:putative voltage-gated calcium channel alpha2-delta subunit 1, partial [Operophtera brumata]
AVPETIRELKTSLWNAELSGGVANLTGALATGFEILHRAIAVIGAGGGSTGVKSVFRTWNWPHMPVRIFTYRVGGDATAGHTMKDMACTNKGFYVSINEHAEIRSKVLHFVEVLARPLVMYQNVHPSSNLNDNGMGQLMSSVTVPIFDRRNHTYTETLRPLYSSVDLTDVELLIDAEENSRVNLTSLLLDVQYDSMRRVATRRQRYFYSPVDGTPFSLAVVLPDGYGMYDLLSEQEVKHSPVSVTEYFKGENWKIHPDWVYCEYASTSEQTFNSPEEQLLHFLNRAGKPGWKWMSLRPRALTLHNAHKKQERDSYYCDKNLVQSLIRDAMVIKELDAHMQHASHHNQQGRFHKFHVTLSFIATRSGLLKWTENMNTSRGSDSSETHFSEKYSRAFDSEWYKRAVEHHAIEPESFVFSVPFRDGSEAEDLSGRPPLVLATHAVFVESRAHRAPAAVVGLHFQLDSLARHFLNVTSTCTAGSVCKKTCAGDELDCYILDDNGFIIISEDVAQTGRFFGQVDGTIMDSLVQDKIYKKVTVNDHQGRCPDARNPFSGEASMWFPLWQPAKAHPNRAYGDEDSADYEDYENEDGDHEDGPIREPPREAARSAAVRPCDTSAELYQLQSTRLNQAQPLKGKLTNCHNSGCER